MITSPKSTDFSAENYTLYENAVTKIRVELSLGHTYDHACETLTGLDHDMKAFVKEEFLKIYIAEEYFGGLLEISDMALLLGLSYEKVQSSMQTLVHDMVNETNLQNMSENFTIQ